VDRCNFFFFFFFSGVAQKSGEGKEKMAIGTLSSTYWPPSWERKYRGNSNTVQEGCEWS